MDYGKVIRHSGRGSDEGSFAGIDEELKELDARKRDNQQNKL
ncbi:MAG: hypothetical protein WBO48_10100 [Candidatus Promineifilaceae bacterium]